MLDARERAIEAISLRFEGGLDRDFAAKVWRAGARAALDPEDQLLVEAVARAIMALDLDDASGDWTNYRLRAVAAIATLNRALAAAADIQDDKGETD